MGHTVNPDKEHHLLRKRYDRMVTGAPDSPHIVQILALLFTPEEARLARKLPAKPMPLAKLSSRVGIPETELDERLTEMAHRGLVLDFTMRGKRYFMLPPVVIGFFEFVFMRTRDELPMKELAGLFDAYMYKEDQFGKSVFAANTQVGRSLTHEEALADEDFTEILDWERSTRIIETASAIGVSMCACRHKKLHLGDACDAPMEVCFSLNQAATTMARNGIARLVDKAEGLALLEQSKAAGLAQTGDNVQKNMTYICNCCGCCCGMLNAIRTLNLTNAVVASNWVMALDANACKGCGKCEKACPIDAISMMETTDENGKMKKKAKCDTDLCLGCGVCYSSCKFDAINMKRREKRIIPPETTFDKVVAMAIERGKLVDLIFDEPENLGYRALGRMLSALEKTPPVQALLAIQPLRSAFLNAMVGSAKRM